MARPEVGIERCEQIRAWLPDDRMVDAHAEVSQGACAVHLGRFEEGRERQGRAEEIFLDLGQKLWLGGLGLNKGWLEILAGDLEAAEHAFREGMRMLESIGELGFRSTMAMNLAGGALRARSLRRGGRHARRVRRHSARPTIS